MGCSGTTESETYIMRTDIASNIQSAADDLGSINAAVSAIIFKTRQYFVHDDLDISATGFAEPAEIADSPLGQDVKWSPRTYDIYSLYADSDVLKLETASSGLQTLAGPLDTHDLYRPGLWTSLSGEEIWWANDTSGIFFAELSGYTVSGTSNIVLSATSTGEWYGRNAPGAIHPVDSQEAVALWINDGGVSCTFIYYSAGSYICDDWEYRFIDPTSTHTTSDSGDIYQMHYSAAVKNDDGDVHIFMSRWDGSVDVIIRRANGKWSDRRTAIPADLSQFKVTNAFIAPNGYYALVGQFQRIDDTGAFSSDFIYNLCAMSPDGKTFSMDRNTLFAMGTESMSVDAMGFRFFAGVDTATVPNMWISTVGSWASDTAPLYLSDDAETLEITKQMTTYCRGSYGGRLTMRIPDSQEAYFDHAFIHNGAVIDIYLEYMTDSGGYEPVLLRRSIIDDIDQTEEEATRSVTIQAEPYSVWRVSEMTHPFYLELQSKSSIYDDVDEWDNLYEANSSEGLPGHLAVDLWGSGSVPTIEHVAGDKDSLLTDELTTHAGYTQLPTLPSLPFEVSVYGWSRAGSQTPYTGGSGDVPGDANATNDLVTLRMIVDRGAEGNETEYDVEVTEISSDYSRFPRTWYTTADGSYPIVFSVTSNVNLQEGDTLKRIGIYSENENGSDDTIYFIERIESTDIVCQHPQHGEIWEVSGSSYQDGYPDTWTWELAGESLDWVYDNVHDAWWCCSGTYGPLDISYPGGAMRMGYHTGAGGYEVGSMKFVFADGTVFLPPVGDDWSVSFNLSAQKWQSSWTIRMTNGVTWRDLTYGPDAPAGWSTKDQDNSPFNEEMRIGSGWWITELHYGFFDGWSTNGYVDVYDVTTEGLVGLFPETTIGAQTLLRAGVPIVRFSVTPYTTFNCEVAAAYSINQNDLVGGVVLLAADGDNYIAAIADREDTSIIKVRNGVQEVLTTVANALTSEKFWIMAKHNDGEINVYISEGFGLPNYGDPVLTYVWTEADEAICTSDDIMHVGTYSMINTPWVRLTAWSPKETSYIGVLPDTIDGLADFPSSGTLLVNGNKVSYSSKVSQSDSFGPYQCRNTTYWPSYSRDGHSYSAGNAIEFTRFEYIDDSANYDKFNGYLMASDLGEAHIITASDHKPWIRTSGVLVILKNRMRAFASDIDDNIHGTNTKMWITGGFAGCQNEGEEDYNIIEGDIGFLYGDDYRLQLLGFVASSQHEDATVEDMIEKIMYMSAAEPSFPGDTLVASQALTGAETEIT